MLKLLVALVLAVALGTTARAESRQVDWAAIAASLNAHHQPEADKYEYGGIIYSHKGTILWSAPETDEEIDAVSIRIHAMLDPDDTLLGVYHTHPCMPNTHYVHLLSKPDVLMGYFNQVPVYMLDECTGDVHVYDPKIDHIRDTAVPVHVRDYLCHPIAVVLPTGRIIGNIRETDPPNDTGPRKIIPCIPG